jgi:glycerophosphoryl diester phosphodiesterase
MAETPDRRRLSRRELGLATAGAALASALPARADPATGPVIIAQGGAAEDRIEDTRSALELAVQQNADFLQVNVVPTKEGALVARRDNELSASTDVSAHPEFADRRTSKTIDGAQVTGWFAEDFTLPELQTLFCREAEPALRPGNVKLNGKEPMLTFAQVLQIARDGCVKTGRTIGVCPRLIKSAYFEPLDLHVGERLAEELSTQGYFSPAAAIWVQSGDPDVLKAFARVSRVRRMQMIEPGPNAAAMTSSQALSDIRAYAHGLGPHQDLLIDPAAAVYPAPTTLAMDAHNAGLQVFSHTARGQNAWLPAALRRNGGRNPADRGDVDKLLVALFSDLIDGVATDLPALADRARRSVLDALTRAAQQQGRR